MKNESEIATSKYQGYGTSTISADEKEFAFLSEYAFHMHFRGRPHWRHDWGRVVDFGGRIGERTKLIDNVVVVEIDSVARKWMKEHGRECLESMDTIKDGSIDTLYSSHALEHLENPIDYLRLFARKMKPDGILILAIPYETGGFEGTATDSNGHLYAWNMITINTLLERAGFTVKSNRYATLAILAKTIGWDAYVALIRNGFMNTVLRLSRTILYQLLNRRASGELIIMARKSK